MDGYTLIYFVVCAVPTLLWVFRKIHIGGSVFDLTWKIIAIRLCIALLGSSITIYFLIGVCMWKLAIEGFFTAAILLIITFGLNFLLVSLDCARHEHGTENHPLCGWKINGYTNKKITIRFI